MPETAPYGTGKRKNAIARVWVTPGSGKIVVNNKPLEDYFGRMTHQQTVREPLTKTSVGLNFDVNASVHRHGHEKLRGQTFTRSSSKDQHRAAPSSEPQEENLSPPKTDATPRPNTSRNEPVTVAECSSSGPHDQAKP